MIRNALFNIFKSTFLASLSVVHKWIFWPDCGNIPWSSLYYLSFQDYSHLELIIFWPLILPSHTIKLLTLNSSHIVQYWHREESGALRNGILHCLGDFSGFLTYSHMIFAPFICVQNKRHLQNSFPHSLHLLFLLVPFSFLPFSLWESDENYDSSTHFPFLTSSLHGLSDTHS